MFQKTCSTFCRIRIMNEKVKKFATIPLLCVENNPTKEYYSICSKYNKNNNRLYSESRLSLIILLYQLIGLRKSMKILRLDYEIRQYLSQNQQESFHIPFL